MKIEEIELEALKKHYQKKGYSEEQINEIVPALAGIAARGAASLGGAAAKGLAKGAAAAGKGIARGVAGAAKGISRGATTSAATGIAKGAVAGTLGKDNDKKKTPAEKRKAKEIERSIRPGGTIKLPTKNKKNKTSDFKIKRTVGQEVEIENPKPKPGEPKSFVFNKDDLKNQLKDMK